MTEPWEDGLHIGRHEIVGGFWRFGSSGHIWGGGLFILFGTMHDDGVLERGVDHVSTAWSGF